jgi:hypothetical protein
MDVSDVILEVISEITFNIEPKDVFNGILVTIERGSGEWQAATHIGLHPFLVDFLQCYLLGFVNCIHKPNVFFEYGW